MKFHSKKNISHIRCWLTLLLVLCCVLLPARVSKAERKASEGGMSSYNVSWQNYSTWSSPMKSYLYENKDKTITRVELVDSEIIYENYDKSFKLLTKGTIKKELSLFGGF